MKIFIGAGNITVRLFSLGIVASLGAGVPLYNTYPQLEQKIPHVVLGDFPTPLDRCASLSQEFGCTLLCKREDCAGPLQLDGTRLFGGNKVRKLEFVLADALAKGFKNILTFGAAGSNHALATSIYARKLGLETRALLCHQPNSWVVQRNLLLQLNYGADLYNFTNRREATVLHTNEITKKTGAEPYVIPPGASVPLGVIGYINAIFELDEQLKAAQISQLDYIYVPAGSFGTVVGILIGLQLIGASTQVIAVAIEPDNIVPPLRALFERTKDLLVSYDSSFSKLAWDEQQMQVYDTFCGEGYGATTKVAEEAIALFKRTEDIVLEDTYTAKAAAALIYDVRRGLLRDKNVLFLLTFFGDSCKELCDKVSYKDLPSEFHQYFE